MWPTRLARGLGHPLAFAVIVVRHPTRRVGPILGVIVEGVAELIVLQVAAGVVGIADELIVAAGRSRERIGHGMRGTDHVVARGLLGEVAPDVNGVLGAPIGGVVPSRLDAVQLVVFVVRFYLPGEPGSVRVHEGWERISFWARAA